MSTSLKLSLSSVNYINIGLMFLSMILAINLPFELFLFAYAVLGPLHYMTEIGWLHQKNYFSIDKKDFIIPIVMCSLISISVLFGVFSTWEPTMEATKSFYATSFGKKLVDFLDAYSVSFIFLAFTSGIFMATVKKRNLRYILMALMVVPAVLTTQLKYWNDSYITWFGIYLPTIIHVSLFTGLFILYGAMKSKSSSGYLSFAIYLLCIFILFNIDFISKNYGISMQLFEKYQKSSFDQLNKSMWDVLHPIKEKHAYVLSNDGQSILAGKWVLKIQAFIAFVYTYHYLNWFSKTEVIKWHQVPKLWLILTVVVWVSAVGLYYYDYRVGLLALYFLSMLHVFLEFPLNIQSIIGIGKEGRSWFKPRST